MSAAKIINTLWPDVVKYLTDEQLEQLSYSDLHGTLGNTAEVMMGIGCLVAEDGAHKIPSGNFQDSESVAKLLWFFSDLVETAAVVSRVSGDAKTMLSTRLAERSTKQRKETKA
ncbi:hypothetical protein [Propionivibrio sp.]|uniref:hypothetical protein n=1 Tax=Propionivibrio sp. TaxID=2212460 RepID=UPI0039E3C002